MATTTTNLGLPRPVASDNVTLANDQALIDAIDANAAKKTDLTTHTAATTGVHGATSAATASKITIRDAAGRAQFADPSAAGDAVNKGYMEANTWNDNATVRRSSVRAYQSTSQTLSANVSAKVNYQTVIFDNIGEFNAGLSRFIASHGGHYLIIVGLSVPNVTVATRVLINVGVNGTENVRVYDSIIPPDNSNSIAAGSCIISLTANDFVEIQAFSTTTFNVENSATKTIFEVTRIA